MWKYRMMAFVYALFSLKPPPYVDEYGRIYDIDKKGTWRRRKDK